MENTLSYESGVGHHPWMTDDIAKKIGAEIRRLRKASGMSVEQLANEIDRDKGKVSKMETRGEELTIWNLEQVANALGVKLWEIIAAAEGDITHQAIELDRALTKIGEPALNLLNLITDMREAGEIDDFFLQSVADMISAKPGTGQAERREKRKRKDVKQGKAHE